MNSNTPSPSAAEQTYPLNMDKLEELLNELTQARAELSRIRTLLERENLGDWLYELNTGKPPLSCANPEPFRGLADKLKAYLLGEEE